MRKLISWLLILVGTLLASCDKDGPKEMLSPVSTQLSKLMVAGSSSFISTTGNAFFPWGFNYTNTDFGLIEDRWMEPEIWSEIEQDFVDMRELGANVVRIHLQYHRFMNDVVTPNEAALGRLKDLVKVAENNGLYLDVTGLASYRKSDQPSWYTGLSDAERWNTQVLFWKNIARSIGNSPAIFAYNLMNEPVVAVGCEDNLECDWLPGDGFGGYHFVQNVSRDAQRPFLETMKAWMAEMSAAIRSEDQSTMITAGLLALGPATRFSEDLDYLSPHIYPRSGELEKSVEYVKDNQGSTPLVIEETSNLFCNIDELTQFVNEIEGLYQGLLGHYSGKNLSELDRSLVSDAIEYNFLQFFMNENPN